MRFLFLAAMTATMSCAPAESPLAPMTPNILWILAEDMGPEIGAYGYPGVKTPHLDRLAAEGASFTHAFTTAPVCSAARSALMTGMYQTTIGAHNHRSHRSDGYQLPEGVRVLTDRLRDHGYYTGNIVELPKTDELDFEGTGKTDWNFEYEGEPFDTDRWSDLKSHQPFYAQVNFPETHRGTEWDEAEPRIEPTHVVLPPYYPDHPVVRADWAQYLNTIMALDDKVGAVIELLERDGLAENTVVVFMSDHGRAMVRGKQWPYDSGLRVPLIIRGAPGLEANTVHDELIASIDITATTLALAGVSPPASMQGRVVLGDARDEPRAYVFGGRDRGDETVDRIRTVRDRRYRYIKNFYPERSLLQLNRYKEFTYPMLPVMRELHANGELSPPQAYLFAPTRPEDELYDLDADPFEVNNLAEHPEHGETLERLRRELEAWIVDSNDQGRFPEPPEVVEYWEDRMHEVYGDPEL